MKESINISVWGFDLDVDFYYHKGYDGSMEEPPEPESLEIDSITFLDTPENKQGFSDSGMTEEELQNSAIFTEAVEQAIWESREDDYDDSNYEPDDNFDDVYWD